jgi:hypothetical protein
MFDPKAADCDGREGNENPRFIPEAVLTTRRAGETFRQ